MYFNLTVYNFINKRSFWYKLKSCHRQLSTNKHVEIEFFFSSNDLFSFEIDAKLSGRDHAGIRLKLSLLGLEVNINFYDSRHWDYKNNKWH